LTEPCTEKSRIAVIETYQKEIREDVKSVLEILQGNSKPGLKTQVAIHSKYFKIIAVVGGMLLTGRIVWSYIFP
jgi:hypothetical protein